MTFQHNGRTYTVDRIYDSHGEIRIECHYVENGQGIGRTWRLSDLELPEAIVLETGSYFPIW